MRVFIITSAVLVLAFAACGGAIAPVPGSEGSTTTSSSSGSGSGAKKPPSSYDDGDDDDDKPPTSNPGPGNKTPPKPPVTPTKDLPTGGTCASKTALAGGIASSGPQAHCEVSNEVSDPASGLKEISTVKGINGAADMKDGALLLRCDDGVTTLFQAVVRCFTGDGDYTVAAGDIILGGQISDRSCRLSLDTDIASSPNPSNVRGFIDCPNAPANDSVFASNGPPIGLGYFELPRSF